MSALLRCWLADPLPEDVERALQRLGELPDARRIAVMPDVHRAEDVCVGTVLGSAERIYPQAVGGDIGCGMSTVRLEADAGFLTDERSAAAVLSELSRLIPAVRRAGSDIPDAWSRGTLSDSRLERIRGRDGRVQFGTLGRGNHFLEFQRDAEESLWVMVHSGSRALGPAIRDHHLARTPGEGIRGLEADGDAGRAYLSDLAWAVAYAQASRRWMLEELGRRLETRFGVAPVRESFVDCVHNQVQLESIGGEELWIHRKGALRAHAEEAGLIPGSMGSPSYHVLGRGCDEALRSSSHGAGRRVSRSAARQAIGVTEFRQQMKGVWYDHRLATQLVEEAPEAYKDITRVMRAQRELTRIVRMLRPVLSYKAP